MKSTTADLQRNDVIEGVPCDTCNVGVGEICVGPTLRSPLTEGSIAVYHGKRREAAGLPQTNPHTSSLSPEKDLELSELVPVTVKHASKMTAEEREKYGLPADWRPGKPNRAKAKAKARKAKAAAARSAVPAHEVLAPSPPPPQVVQPPPVKGLSVQRLEPKPPKPPKPKPAPPAVCSYPDNVPIYAWKRGCRCRSCKAAHAAVNRRCRERSGKDRNAST